MHKRLLLAMLIVGILLMSLCAYAENTNGQGDLMISSEGLAAYVDGDGHLLIPGNDEPINEHIADAVIAINPYRVAFTGASADGEGKDLVVIDFSTYQEKVFDHVYAATATDSSTLYYVSADDRNTLYQVDFDADRVLPFHTFSESIDGLYDTVNGLVVSFVEDAGANIYSNIFGTFEPYGDPLPVKSIRADGIEAYIADGSSLYVRKEGMPAADYVDQNVFDFTMLDGDIFYIANTGSAIRIKRYNPTTQEQRVVTTPDITVQDQIAASGSGLFVLGADNRVYRLNPSSGALTAVSSGEQPLIGANRQVESYALRAASGQVNVYANVADVSDAPALTFIQFSSDVSAASATEPVLVDTLGLTQEEPAWKSLQPAVQYSPLSRGNRGNAVRAIQQPLFDHGYYDYYVDGIFGYRTDNAVRMLQSDLGLPVNGIADADLQRRILSGNFPNYDPYAEVAFGDRGDRVLRMQLRLRELGYMADGADGIFGNRTLAAVQLFQQENNIPVSRAATRDTLIRLYSSAAPQCSSYIPLYRGDTGYRVRALNKRLKELFYYSGKVTDTYTSETAAAVRRFQAQVGLPINGEASVILQQRLFAPGAPECSGYIALYRGDENTRVARLQRRLKELGYYDGPIDGYFGKSTQKAVKLFQEKVGMKPNGVATIAMQELLFSPNAPIYVKPTLIGVPVITMDAYQRQEGGVFYVNDETTSTGYITFSWAAEGEVDSYGVQLSDGDGKTVYASSRGELTTSTLAININTLVIDKVYQLTVTAYPEDGDASHITYASIRFCRTQVPAEPEPVVGTIISVNASIDPVTRVEDEVYYVRAENITLRWYAVCAEGDLKEYYVELRDSNGNLLVSANRSDEATSISTENMVDGERYTFNVYAIPTNGTMEDVKLKSIQFQLEPNAPQIPHTGAPNLTITGATLVDDAYALDGDTAMIEWNTVEQAAQYFVEILDSGNTLLSSDTTTDTRYQVFASAFTQGQVYTVRVTSIPEGGTTSDGDSATLPITLPQAQTVTILDAPTITLDRATTTDDGIAYAQETALTFHWNAVNGAQEYNVIVRDSNGSIKAQSSVAETSYVFDASPLTRGAAYSFSVTAVPAEGMNAQGTPGSIAFVVEEVSQAEVSLPEEEPETVETEMIEETVSVNAVGTPEIDVNPKIASDGDTVYVAPGSITFSWYASGDIANYHITILDDYGVSYVDRMIPDQGGTLDSSVMQPGRIYTLIVATVPADDSVESTQSAIRFAVQTDEMEATEEPQIATTPEPDETPVYAPSEEPTAVPAVEEQVDMSVSTEPPQEENSVNQNEVPAPVDAIPDMPETAIESEQALEEQEPAPDMPEEATDAPWVGIPQIWVTPTLDIQDGVYYVSPDLITFSWSVEGDVGSYTLQILQNGIQQLSQEFPVDQNTISFNAANVQSGELYEFRVIAIPSGYSMEYGNYASIYFAVFQDTTLSDEPAVTETPYEEPSMDVYSEPETYETQPEYSQESPCVPDYSATSESEPQYAEPYSEPYTDSYAETYTETYAEPYTEPYTDPYVEQYEEPYSEPYTDPYADDEQGVYEEPVNDAQANPWSMPLDTYGDPNLITQVQQALVMRGLLGTEYTMGVLDEATVNAIIQFQTDMGLMPVAWGEYVSIPSETLMVLMG
ncbi:MAG: peptidoglycan-binding protein [Clostridia bacterium]|nr:peptidoglycan-binding protein [Clostridia bacterium]